MADPPIILAGELQRRVPHFAGVKREQSLRGVRPNSPAHPTKKVGKSYPLVNFNIFEDGREGRLQDSNSNVGT